MIFLPLPPEYWVYKLVSQCLTSEIRKRLNINGLSVKGYIWLIHMCVCVLYKVNMDLSSGFMSQKSDKKEKALVFIVSGTFSKVQRSFILF